MIWASLGLSVLSIWSLYLISRGDRTGWVIGMLAQPPWAVYSAVTGQWGFVLLSFIYTWVNAKGYANHVGSK